MTTANIVTTKSGTLFTVDVTAANLLPDVNIKDFVVYHDSVIVSLSNYTKLSQTSIQYTGAILPSTTVEVRRNTPTTVLTVLTALFLNKLSSADFNKQIEYFIRRFEEADLNGIGPGSVLPVPVPSDAAFSSSWNGDSIYAPTKNALYDILITLAPLFSPAFTGNPTVPDQADGSGNSTIANTKYADNRVANALAGSPTLGGTPTVPTTPGLTDNTKKVINTEFIQKFGKPETQDFRLSVQTGVAYPVSDLTVSTLYLTPAIGNRICFYESGAWTEYQSSEISFALSGLTTSLPYDVFVYYNSGLTVDVVAWASTTARAVALTYVDGVPCKSGATNRRLIGGFMATAVNATKSTADSRLVSNVNNLTRVHVAKIDTTATWTLASLSWRQANSTAGNKIDIFQLLPTQPIQLNALNNAVRISNDEFVGVAIGEDSNTPHSTCIRAGFFVTSSLVENTGTAHLALTPTIGYHQYRWLERVFNGFSVTMVGYGVSDIVQAGICGTWYY